MIIKLLNRLQGKTWGARCNICHWYTGRNDLLRRQATARAMMHRKNCHHLGNTTIYELPKLRVISVRTRDYIQA